MLVPWPLLRAAAAPRRCAASSGMSSLPGLLVGSAAEQPATGRPWRLLSTAAIVSGAAVCRRGQRAQISSADVAAERSGAVRELQAAGIEESEAKASVRWLLEEAQRRGDDWKRWLHEAVARRARREPVQYIVGRWPFHPLEGELVLRPPVLIPRPETEELVDWIRESLRSRAHAEGRAALRFADVGSGTGAITVALLTVLQGSEAIAVEPFPVAAALTAENARRFGVEDRLEVVGCPVASWAERAAPGSLDFLVSNPPYIPAGELPELQPEVRCFEDASALDGGEDGLDVVRDVLQCARCCLKPGGRIFLEVHHTHPAVFEQAALGHSSDGAVLDLRGLRLVRTAEDLFGQPRFVELAKQDAA